MKHLFVVHSNITYLSALGVMALEGISDTEVHLLSQGAFMRSEPVAVVGLPYFSGLKANRFNLSNYWNPCGQSDRAIAQLADHKPFTAYVSTLNPLARCLITHPLCAEFHFIEEGLQSYVASFDLRTMTAHNPTDFRARGLCSRLGELKGPFFRGYPARLTALPLFYNAYGSPTRRFYGYHPDSFGLIDPSCRRLISLGQVVDRFSFTPALDLNGAVVWLGDCVGSGSTWQEYLTGIEHGFIEAVLIPRGIGHIKLKHHYREPQELRAATVALFARYGIETESIPDQTVLEIELLATQTPAELYSTYSSLLVYAVFAGHRAFSIDRHYAGGVSDARLDFFFSLVQRT